MNAARSEAATLGHRPPTVPVPLGRSEPVQFRPRLAKDALVDRPGAPSFAIFAKGGSRRTLTPKNHIPAKNTQNGALLHARVSANPLQTSQINILNQRTQLSEIRLFLPFSAQNCPFSARKSNRIAFNLRRVSFVSKIAKNACISAYTSAAGKQSQKLTQQSTLPAHPFAPSRSAIIAN